MTFVSPEFNTWCHSVLSYLPFLILSSVIYKMRVSHAYPAQPVYNENTAKKKKGVW
jgi:hypothetical protein